MKCAIVGCDEEATDDGNGPNRPRNYYCLNHAIACGVNTPPTIQFAGGKATSSKIPRFDLIPREALVRMADRFALGVEIHKDKSWNALSNNQECLKDKAMIMARIAHVIDHAYKLQADLIAGEVTDDHMAAIMWGGAFLACAIKTPVKKDT